MEIENLQVSELKVSEVNPRFSMTEIAELAQSIKVHGIIEPLVVEHVADGTYVVAGHRRLAAARRLGLPVVPCVTRPGASHNMSVLHLVENIQRVDLTPMETALGVAAVMEAGTKQKEIAKLLGRSAGWVSKFATIAKAYAKKEGAKDKAGAYMIEITDSDKLYTEARKVLGLDKKEKQLDLAGIIEDAEEKDDEETSEKESIELEVIGELKRLAETGLMTSKAKAEIGVEPHGKSGYRVTYTFKNEAAAKAAFGT